MIALPVTVLIYLGAAHGAPAPRPTLGEFMGVNGHTVKFKPELYGQALFLGEYRFQKAVEKQAGERYVFEFDHAANPKRRVLVAWSPTGSERTAAADLPIGGARVVRVEEMPLAPGDAPKGQATVAAGAARVTIGESPLYLWLED